ncbi:MAG TPA: sulfatase-like hydrolase/transferase [Gemmataceae bacterium]|nr:sulfatase-like hydrolase/transferase [Gemmataceae bacterium]
MHRLSCTLLLSVVALIAVSSGNAEAQAPRKPNIVFIMADDLGVHDLGCYGRKDQPTPNLDKLAKQGIRFTSAYAAASVCSPTRAAIMTGMSPARLKLTTFLPGRPDTPAQMLLHPNIAQQLPRDYRSLAEYLRTAGYISACIGKWHLGGKGSLPTDRGFDVYHPGKALTDPSKTEGGKGEYDLTNAAEKFIDANKDKSFFLYLCHNNPHVQLVAKQELIEKHKNAFNPVYAAMIETLDDCVGRVIAKLEQEGLLENTIIVFASDNGGLHVLESPRTPATYNRPYRAGKGFLYEGGVRIPLIVCWKGKIQPGQECDVPVIATDWTPTFLALASAKATAKFDGVDLSDLLLHGKAPPTRALYWHQPHYMNQGSRPSGAIRDGAWKLVEHYENGACELYDLARDVSETTDLAAREPARVADLRGKLEKWRRDVGAQENRANPKFNGVLWRKLYHDVDASRLMLEDKASSMATKLQPWRALMNDVLPKKKQATAGAGAVILHARDAKVHGSKLRYENPPHKDTLGFWVQKDDWAEWTFDVPAAGKFEVEVLQACGKGSGGAEIEISVKGQTLTLKIEETGHFQRFIPRTAGVVTFDAPGPQTLSVRAKTKPGPAVMDLRRVTLKSAP